MFLQQLINGLMLGTMYALVAIGYTLILGVLHLLNFAHGEVFMLGAFVGGAAMLAAGFPLWLAFIGALVLGGLLGLVIYYCCFKPVKAGFFFAPAISTLGLSIMFVDLAQKFWGTDPVPFESLKLVTYQFFGLVITNAMLLILGTAVALMIAFDLLLMRTRLGLAIRALSEYPIISNIFGINSKRTVVWVFVICSGLGSLAGLLWAMRIELADPHVGFDIAIKAIAAMVIGGLGNVRGAMVGGLILGFAEVLTIAFLEGTYTDVVVWLSLILILIFKPEGLFGTQLAGGR